MRGVASRLRWHFGDFCKEYQLDRRRMPENRDSITRKFELPWGESPSGTLTVYVTVGLLQDGAPGEIFLRAQKVGGLIHAVFDAVAISTSIALQHGVPLSAIADHWKGMQFEPRGPTGDRDYPMVSSMFDYIGRWLRKRFGGKKK